MSRLGKLPVEIVNGAKANIAGQEITITGSKGTLKFTSPQEVTVKQEANALVFKPVNDSKRARAMWGMVRSQVKNMVVGTTEGYTKVLEINGVGFRAALQGQDLKLNLGFSHDVIYKIPQGITIKVDKQTVLTITGADKQKVGQVAAEIRGLKPPEPYKAKGIKYSTERIRRKEGKKK